MRGWIFVLTCIFAGGPLLANAQDKNASTELPPGRASQSPPEANTKVSDATTPKVKGRVIKVDHLSVDSLAFRNETFADGEAFTILVQNTYPDRFNYELQAVKLLANPPGGESGAIELTDRPVPGVHHKDAGGYVLKVTSRDGKSVTVGANPPLKDFTLLLGVTTAGWEIETAGAFTTSGLTDSQYFTDDEKKVQEDSDAKDSAKLGVGAFVHLYHNRRPKVALSFGLAINDSGRTTYFLGPSWRLGGKAWITGGIAAGAVSRLPNGVAVDKPLVDANALATLPTRTGVHAFVAFSYAFLGGADAHLKKPFEAPSPKAPAAEEAKETAKENGKGTKSQAKDSKKEEEAKEGQK